MKTRDIVFYATLAVAALAMAGCEKSNDMPQESGPGHPAEIRFAPAIVPLTRATGTAFEEGDAVGIYCVESTDDPAAAIVGERYIDNKQLTMTAGTLTGTTPCFWPTEYTGPSDFYAYFPYNEKGLSGAKQSYEISAALDQSDDEAFRTSDHMLARAQNTARTEKAIPLDFKRLMSLLDFVLLPGTGYDDVDGILAAEVQVMNMAQVANVDFVTGEVSSPAIKANITPHGSFRASDGKAVGVEAIVPPQHVDTRSYLFNVRIGERNFRCTTDKELTFEAGRRYTFTLTINRAAAGGAVAHSLRRSRTGRPALHRARRLSRSTPTSMRKSSATSMATNTLSCASARNNGRCQSAHDALQRRYSHHPARRSRSMGAVRKQRGSGLLSVRQRRNQQRALRYALQLACGEHRKTLPRGMAHSVG